MYNPGGYGNQYTHDLYSGAPQGSKLSPQDQAMLSLVSHSLGSKQLYNASAMQPHQQMGSYSTVLVQPAFVDYTWQVAVLAAWHLISESNYFGTLVADTNNITV